LSPGTNVIINHFRSKMFEKTIPLIPVQERNLAVVIFNIPYRFPNRNILGRGQKGRAFGLECEPKPLINLLPRFNLSWSHISPCFYFGSSWPEATYTTFYFGYPTTEAIYVTKFLIYLKIRW